MLNEINADEMDKKITVNLNVSILRYMSGVREGIRRAGVRNIGLRDQGEEE